MTRVEMREALESLLDGLEDMIEVIKDQKLQKNREIDKFMKSLMTPEQKERFIGIEMFMNSI
jgi:CII-binding regulator of phage lambda lysogenization HflD